MGTITCRRKDKEQLEETIVKYNIFARHRIDIGLNNNFKVKLLPKDENPVYTQSLPVPINLREDLAVKLALMLWHNNNAAIL